MADHDSIPIETAQKVDQPISLKSIVVLYAIFLFVTSSTFVNHILCNFGGAVTEREPTNVGIMLMGIFLVIFYILSLYLIKQEIL